VSNPLNVFSAWVDHGVNPNNASYAYAVVPHVTAGALDSYYNNLPISVLANTASLQAVRNNTLGITQAVFYAAGTLTLANGMTVTTSDPCLVMLREIPAGGIELSVSDPTHSLAQVRVTINRHITGAGA